MVPEQYSKEFNSFVTMSEPQLDRLLVALERAAPDLLISEVAEKVAETSGADLGSTRDLLFMLASIERSRSGEPTDAFVDELLDDAEAGGGLPPDIDPAVAKKRLLRALSASAIQVTAKALQVAGDHQRLFCTARILSDLRPIFSDTLEVSGSVIIHQFKIAYHEHGLEDGTGEIYMSVDRRDLLRLKATVERALQKHEKLADMAENLGIRLLGGRNR